LSGISFAGTPLFVAYWETMKKGRITTYYLINKCGFSSNKQNEA